MQGGYARFMGQGLDSHFVPTAAYYEVLLSNGVIPNRPELIGQNKILKFDSLCKSKLLQIMPFSVLQRFYRGAL